MATPFVVGSWDSIGSRETNSLFSNVTTTYGREVAMASVGMLSPRADMSLTVRWPLGCVLGDGGLVDGVGEMDVDSSVDEMLRWEGVVAPEYEWFDWREGACSGAADDGGEVGFRRRGGVLIRKSGGWIESEVVGGAVVPLSVHKRRGTEGGVGKGRRSVSMISPTSSCRPIDRR